MKKRAFVFLFAFSLIMLCTIVIADVAAPEPFSHYSTFELETNPIVYVGVAIVIVVTACIISVLINKKNEQAEQENKGE